MRRNRTAIVIALFVLLGASLGVGYASAGSPASERADFQRTPDGRTIGGLSSDPTEAEPDLVGVVGDSGKNGYAVREELFGESDLPRNPQDAVLQQQRKDASFVRGDRTDRVVTVFSADGVTPIDTFTIKLVDPDSGFVESAMD